MFSGFLGKTPREVDDTHVLINQVRALRERSALPDVDAMVDFLSSVLEQAGGAHDATLGMRIGRPVFDLVSVLFQHEPLAVSLDHDPAALTLATGAQYRNVLRQALSMYGNERYLLGKWNEAMVSLLSVFYREFPDQAFVDPDEDGKFEEYSRLSPTAPLYTYVKNVPKLIHQIIATVFASDLASDRLFADLRDQLLINIASASRIPVEERYTTNKTFLMPEDKGGDDGELLIAYLRGTPFLELFLVEIPLCIPEAVRFEHTHIVAGTGHGKTQTLQFLIAGDLETAANEKRSVVVMDSQGDLLQTLMRSDYFAHPALRDRFVYIDPTDLERPVGLNLFDFDLSGTSDPVARETILNNTIELYDFFFGALLGAELTQKQGLVFRYLAVLMMRIPGATIHTLRELMEDGQKFRPHMQSLQGSARVFFETRFFDKAFTETKKQVLNRLWGVLSNQTLDRMMSAPRNTVDLFSSLQDGSVIFINTAKDFLGEEGCAIFSRMFVALLGQAFMRRAAIPKHDRTPTYLYIDEAERVVDTTLSRMLAQIRKYKGAITFAHQNLDQLESGVRAGVMANTSIKLAGGVSARDATALASEFRTSADFLLGQRKSKTETSFACFARNVTEQAVPLSIPLGYLESHHVADETAYRDLIEASRQKYGMVYVEPGAAAEEPVDSPSDWLAKSSAATSVASTDAVAPLPQPAGACELESVDEPAVRIVRAPASSAPIEARSVGGGGVKHKYIEHLIKELGEERGFRAAVEEQIHDGAGRVDVILRRDELSLAFEISVTTTKDHELENVEKCLALPFSRVVVVTSHARRLKSLSAYIATSLDEEERKRVRFLLPEELSTFLDGHPQSDAPKEKTVKGYTVRSRISDVSRDEAVARRRAIASVVARSLGD